MTLTNENGGMGMKTRMRKKNLIRDKPLEWN